MARSWSLIGLLFIHWVAIYDWLGPVEDFGWNVVLSRPRVEMAGRGHVSSFGTANFDIWSVRLRVIEDIVIGSRSWCSYHFLFFWTSLVSSEVGPFAAKGRFLNFVCAWTRVISNTQIALFLAHTIAFSAVFLGSEGVALAVMGRLWIIKYVQDCSCSLELRLFPLCQRNTLGLAQIRSALICRLQVLVVGYYLPRWILGFSRISSTGRCRRLIWGCIGLVLE